MLFILLLYTGFISLLSNPASRHSHTDTANTGTNFPSPLPMLLPWDAAVSPLHLELAPHFSSHCTRPPQLLLPPPPHLPACQGAPLRGPLGAVLCLAFLVSSKYEGVVCFLLSWIHLPPHSTAAQGVMPAGPKPGEHRNKQGRAKTAPSQDCQVLCSTQPQAQQNPKVQDTAVTCHIKHQPGPINCSVLLPESLNVTAVLLTYWIWGPLWCHSPLPSFIRSVYTEYIPILKFSFVSKPITSPFKSIWPRKSTHSNVLQLHFTMLVQVSEVASGCSFQHFTFPYWHLTPHSLHSKFSYRKMDNTNTFSSMHLLTSHTKGAFPNECSSLYGSRSPLCAETSFQDQSGSCFFASSHAGSTITFHIYLLFTAYFLLVESHTEVWIFTDFLHLLKTHFFLWEAIL